MQTRTPTKLQAEVQVLKAQLSEMKAQLNSIMVAAGLLPFNSTGWTHTAHLLGISALNASSYVSGFGTIGNNNQEWIIPCDSLTNYSMMALVMGSVVDYFRPTAGLNYSACDMLMSNTKHQWTNWEYLQSSFWWTPAYGGGLLGGSLPGWPQTQGWTRKSLSSWGSTQEGLGGCCSTTYTQPLSSWGQSFDLYWQ